MGKRIIDGREVSDAQVQAWADEAEAGYDVDELQKGGGARPGPNVHRRWYRLGSLTRSSLS